jgi:hypothetical protein
VAEFLKQSTAYNLILGPYLYASNGLAHDGLTINNADIWISKMYGAAAHPAASVTLVALTQGFYAMSAGEADTGTRGNLKIWTNSSLALPVWNDYLVLPANVYDSWIGGTDYLQVDTTQIGGASAATAADIADAVWNEEAAGHTTAGYAGEQLWTDVNAILADTGTDGVLLAASAVEASKIATGAITAAKFAANAIDAAAIAADAGTEIAAAVIGAAVDGAVTLAVAMKNVNAYAKGIVGIDSTALAYKAADESTTIWTADLTATGRTIT